MTVKKKAILADIFKYASAQYFSQFLGFFNSVLLRRILGPLNFGIWSILKVVLDYAGYTNLGTTSTVTYRVPFLKGRGEQEEAGRLSRVVFNFLSLTTFSCSIIVLIYALIWGRNFSKDVFVGLIAVSILLISQRLYTYYMVLLRANKDFGILGRSIVFDAIINLIFTVTLVWIFRLYGFYIVVIVMPILNVLFIRRYVTYGLKLSLDFKGIVRYIKYGFPLSVSSMLDQVLYSLDRIMIGAMLGLEQLGFYSIALMTRSYGTGVSKNFSIVIQPHFLEDFNPDDHRRSFIHAGIYAQVNSFFMCILLSVIFIFIDPLVYYVLPKFAPGILAMKIYLLSVLFLTVTPYIMNMLVALEKQKVLIAISALAICINAGLNYFLIKNGFGIAGVSSATVASSCFTFMAIGAVSFWGREDIGSFFMFLLKVLFPLAYCTAVLWGVSAIESPSNIFFKALVRAAVFFIFVTPLLIYFEKKFGIMKILLTQLVDKIKARLIKR